MSKLLDGDISHDQITPFLHTKEFSQKQLWKYVKAQVRKHEQETDGVFIADDTIEEKPYTDESDIVCWHYSQRNPC